MTPQVKRLVQTHHRPSVDHDGDTIMVDSDVALPSPPKDKFNFDWFDVGSERFSQAKSQTLAPPVSTGASVHTPPSTKSYGDKPPVSPPLQAFRVVYPPPPSKPLTWVWQCHMCRSRYPLSITRRCLIDGHYYCSGDSSNQRNAKRRRKAQSCTSEFDYVGWQEWGQWVRKCIALRAFDDGMSENPLLQGCQGCSFPSQCRYENRPRIEALELEKYVKDSDLIWEDDELSDDDEIEDIMGPIESVSSYLTNTNKTSVKEARVNKSRKEKKGHNMKLDTRSTNSDPLQSRHQRFYSSLSDLGRLSSPEASPTAETSIPSSTSTSRGRFDPTLPSIAPRTSAIDRIVSRTITLGPTLKLENTNTNTNTAPQPQSPPLFFAASQQARKHRTNSKPTDPTFSTLSPPLSPSLILPPPFHADSSTPNSLIHNPSRQNLGSFLRAFVEPASTPVPSSASSSSSTAATATAASKVSPILQGPDFEDITLSSPVSPDEQRAKRIESRNRGLLQGKGSDHHQQKHKQKQKQKQQRNQTSDGSSGGSGGSGSSGSAATGERMSFLFPTFGFGGSNSGGGSSNAEGGRRA